MSQKPYLAISGSIFGVIAILHLIRLVYQWPAQIGAFAVPLWVSWLGLVLASALCVWAYRLASK